MNRPSPAQRETAWRWLVHEGAAGTAASCAAAADQVYGKLHLQLAPLIGAAGMQAILVRSAVLVRRGLPEVATALDPTTLHSWLRVLDPDVAMDTAVNLFGTVLALLATFIGERLTGQALRRAWPAIEERASTEEP